MIKINEMGETRSTYEEKEGCKVFVEKKLSKGSTT